MALPSSNVSRRDISVLSIGHGCVDVCQGAVPALLPFLIEGRGYSYSQATALLLVMTFTSSLIQPLFGHLADKRSLSWLLPGGVAIGGLGIAAVGFTHDFIPTLAAVGISGIGVGAYHPEGARFANYVSGERRATGMSFYSVGGNIGFALGPIMVTPLVLLFGIGGVTWLALPLAAVTVLLITQLPRLNSFLPDRHPGSDQDGDGRRKDRWVPFAGVAAIAGFRSSAYFGLQAFVPLYFIIHLGSSTALGNAALTVLLVSGAIGTLVGGRVADRLGKRLVMAISTGILTPLILLFLLLGTIPAVAALSAIGFFVVGSFAITVVLGQAYLPNRIGIASGVTLGAAIGFGGFVAYLLGLLADQVSLITVMIVIAALPLPAFLITLMLPADPDSDETAEEEPKAGSAPAAADLKEWPA